MLGKESRRGEAAQNSAEVSIRHLDDRKGLTKLMLLAYREISQLLLHDVAALIIYCKQIPAIRLAYHYRNKTEWSIFAPLNLPYESTCSPVFCSCFRDDSFTLSTCTRTGAMLAYHA